jgi:hypothetical protein
MRIKIDWQKKVEEYRQSKMSKKAWCKEQGISPSTFQHHIGRNQERAKVKFVELKPAFRGIRLRIKSTILELEPDFDQATLKRFLSVLE